MDNRRIERTPLDRTESRGPEGIGGLGNDKAVDSPEFARQIAAAIHERKGTVGEAVLRELVAEFVRPIVSDPQIPTTDRATALREQLLTSVLPQLKESEEFNNLAKTVLCEEIKQRRNLRARSIEDTPT